MIRYLCIALISMLPLISWGQQATAYLDSNEIRIGEQTTLYLELTHAAAAEQIRFPNLKDTISKHIEIVYASPMDTSFDEDDIGTKYVRQQLIVTAWDSGRFEIPAFEFIIDGQVVKSRPFYLTVGTIDILPNDDLKDIKGVIDTPYRFIDWLKDNLLWIILIQIMVILAVVAFILYKRKKRRQPPPLAKPKPKEPAHVIAFRKLEELEQAKLWQQDKIKAYYSDLTFIVREYLENRFDIMALEQTTEEIVQSVRYTDMEQSDQRKLLKLLMMADMAKFAKSKPAAAENHKALADSRELIEHTKWEAPKTEPIEKQEADAVV